MVSLGLSSWHATEVTSGLAEGDKLLWPPEEGEIALGKPVQLGKERAVLRTTVEETEPAISHKP